MQEGLGWIQLVAAPLLGVLSDQVGRRLVGFVSAFGTRVANLFLLPVRNTLFFVNRFSDGFTDGLYSLMCSAVADVSEPQEVSKDHRPREHLSVAR
jgi:MFS family permease